MVISNELLAAYAEGNVSESERKAVRKYLVDHPEELESVMTMMDDDFELDLDNDTKMEGIAPTGNEESFSDICYSAAAFAPRHVPTNKNIIESPGHVDKKSFSDRLGDLLDELDM